MLALTLEGSVLDFQVEEYFGMVEPRADTIGKLNSKFAGPIFPHVQNAKPDWEPIFRDFSVGTRLWIFRVLKDKQDVDIHTIQAWSSQVVDYFRTVYLALVDLITWLTENFWTYGRLFRVLVLRHRTLIRRSGPFVRPSTAASRW